MGMRDQYDRTKRPENEPFMLDTCNIPEWGLREAQTSPCGNTESPSWSIHREQNTGEYSTLDWTFIPCLKAQRSSWKMGVERS